MNVKKIKHLNPYSLLDFPLLNTDGSSGSGGGVQASLKLSLFSNKLTRLGPCNLSRKFSLSPKAPLALLSKPESSNLNDVSSCCLHILADFRLLLAIVFAVFVSITRTGSGCGNLLVCNVNLPV